MRRKGDGIKNWATTAFISLLTFVIIFSSTPALSVPTERMGVVSRSTGLSSGDKYGYVIKASGDLNHDGRVDVVIGAPGADNGDGRVYVFISPSGGLSNFNPSSATTVIYGNSSERGAFGSSISISGDLDGDGLNDIVIGAPGEDRVYVFKGRLLFPSTLHVSDADLVYYGQSGSRFGTSVDFAGDFNGDGNEDLIIGAPDEKVFISGGGSPGYYSYGAAFIFTNASTHLSYGKVNYTMADLNITGDLGNSELGKVVAGIGDINGDGTDDIAINDPDYSSGCGGVFIMFGRGFFDMHNYSAPILVLLKGKTGSHLGSSMIPLGNVADTPEDDILVGAPEDNNATGAAYMFFGSTTFTSVDLSSSSASIEFLGNDTGDRFGASLALAKNFTGEGRKTIFIGAPGRSEGGLTGRGAVYGFYGPFTSSRELAFTADTYYPGESASQGLGGSLGAYPRPHGVNYLLSGSPTYNSNRGTVIVLKRNHLPALYGLYINPPDKGNKDTVFTIRITYVDVDGDAPQYVRLHVYSDISGVNEIVPPVEMRRKNTSTPHYEWGEEYEAQTTLPNSVRPDNDQAPLYFTVEAKASVGSFGPVFSNVPPNLRRGPYVDALPPTRVTTLQAYTVPATSWDDEGRIKIFFEFPADNDFNGTLVGKVKRVVVKMRHNENITEDNWNDNNTTTVIDLSLPDEILNPGDSNADGYELGPDDGLIPGELYYFALKSYDDVGNEAPLSNIASARAGKYWDTVAPQPVVIQDARDRPDDDGGWAQLFWDPVGPADQRDFKEYRVYVRSEFFNNVENFTPEMVITDPMKTFVNISTADGGKPMENGKFYWFAVMAVDVFGNYNPHVTPFGPVRIKNDHDLPPPLVSNLRGYDTPDDEGGAITLEWDYYQVDDFLQYYIWVSGSPIRNVNDAELFTTITSIENNTVVVNKYLGEPLRPGKAYYFAVTVMDFNEKMNTTLTSNNTAGPIFAFDNTDHTPPSIQVRGVMLQDTLNDNGGALDLTWLPAYDVSDFWKYRIYFSDQPITSVVGMTPLTEIYKKETNSYHITEYRGERLIDGHPYWAAVTVVDWNNNENTFLDANNTAGPVEPVNNTDRIPPIGVSGVKVVSVGRNFINITWDRLTPQDVPDFNCYLISYHRSGYRRVNELRVENIHQNWANITGLMRGTLYIINVSIIDDNGNRGPFSENLEVYTAGVNQPPVIISIETYPEDKREFYVHESITFIANATDDYTDPSDLQYIWTITTPDGKVILINRTGATTITKTFDMAGKYTVTLQVMDDSYLVSDNATIEITLKEKKVSTREGLEKYVVMGLVLAVVAAGALFFMMGKKSKEKYELEEKIKKFVEERKRIKEDEPYIYPGIPTWTCSCGKTTVPINEPATCDVCFDSFEGVPVEQIDQWLEEHKEILESMRIKVPPEWPGSERAVEIAEKARKERIRRKIQELMEGLGLTPEILKEHGIELEEWEMPRGSGGTQTGGEGGTPPGQDQMAASTPVPTQPPPPTTSSTPAPSQSQQPLPPTPPKR